MTNDTPNVPQEAPAPYPDSLGMCAANTQPEDNNQTTITPDTMKPKKDEDEDTKHSDKKEEGGSEPIAPVLEPAKAEADALTPPKVEVGRPEDPKEHIRNQLLSLFDREDLSVADRKTQAAALIRSWNEFGATATAAEGKTTDDGESQRVTRRYSFLPVRPKTQIDASPGGSTIADVYDTFLKNE